MMNNKQIQIFTIGFTGKSAEEFFGKLKAAKIKKLIDTRLWASSQLAGFARKKDLPFFTKKLAGAAYEYRDDLAPSQEILKAYKDNRITWDEYEVQYLELINHRNIANVLMPDEVHEACFLCACKTEHNCHRRLLSEYLQGVWKDYDLKITHL